ncbi:deazapurine DNA modification protein DpdA family protein [Streptomyces sp. NBC_01236]|uniref:deazapurine DNA modification protein DpdA family protein n=1 Tax=Streptomyces sp. NBC_01236 TaxID=2903789 RepID=UPI003FA36BBA
MSLPVRRSTVDRTDPLADYPLVGVGSACRRKSVKDVEAVLATVAAGLRLHGSGLKTQALETCAEYLASADSLAWSRDASWNAPLPSCEGSTRGAPTASTGQCAGASAS